MKKLLDRLIDKTPADFYFLNILRSA